MHATAAFNITWFSACWHLPSAALLPVRDRDSYFLKMEEENVGSEAGKDDDDIEEFWSPTQKCFIQESKSADGSAWSCLKQKIKDMDLIETLPKLDATNTLQQEKLQLKDNGGWSGLEQKLKDTDLIETLPKLGAINTLQQDELQLKDNGGASSSLRISATHNKAHGEESEKRSSCRSNLTNLIKAHGKEAIEDSSHHGNHGSGTARSVHGNNSASDQVAQRNVTSKSLLHEICAAKHWVPKYMCHKEEGPSHKKRFTYKVTVEVKDADSFVLECFSRPKETKKAAAKHAAEGALWYLRHLGHNLKKNKKSSYL